ncbi:MAG: ACP phosphodiesterase [Planctomycetes bacterium]|nr:ACP phosphodiesterase [Planctomycetota bacterium]
MNYLAHLFLAHPTPESLLGNLIADSIKGNQLAALPFEIQEGVRQHRRVDSFTDRHPLVQRSITRISKNWGWFSGILIDVYHDHLLATTWELYTSEPLREFIDRVQQQCSVHMDSLPGDGRELLEKMIESDRLYSYLTADGIADALERLSRRIRERIPNRPVHLERAMPDLLANHTDLLGDFQIFFPELIAFVRP